MSETVSIFQQAVKEKLKARVAIDGPTGAGKTFTALQWARILAGPTGKIGLIDTENRSAAYYAPSPAQLAGEEPMDRLHFFDPPYEFMHMAWEPPYDPQKLTDVAVIGAREVGEDGVLIVDSWTHFWVGEGGTLDQVDRQKQRTQGNSFAAWMVGTPLQRRMVDTLIHLPCHVIVTMRSKMEYVLEETERGGKKSTKPVKVGMAPEQRAGIEYEFTVVADMDLDHRLTVSKSRCNLIADAVADKGTTHEPALRFHEWLGSGVERISATAADQLTQRINRAIEDEETRRHLKIDMVRTFGKPTELTSDRLAEVDAWLTDRLAPFADTEPEAEPVEEPVPDAPPDPDPTPDAPPDADTEEPAEQASLLGA